MEVDDQFSSDFQTLTRNGSRDGYTPLRWQQRLFARFCENDIPAVCDLPTGLGKTNVIHIWLLARRYRQALGKKPQLPTRLVYVVDRRTVVDQATDLAEQIKVNCSRLDPPYEIAVSTLRGQLADNREWTRDPSRPAIVIGTVDMIGSRLLFSGYRSSYKLRPLDAGLLGQDTLLVLDEAHLSYPFEKLIRALSDEGEFQRGQGLPMRVMCMSATARGDGPGRPMLSAVARWENEGGATDHGGPRLFKLEPSDLEGSSEDNPIIQRYAARKRLWIEQVERKEIRKRIVDAAADLAKDGSRVVVFVRRPDDARDIGDDIRKLKPFSGAVAILTGTMRGLERDELLSKSSVVGRFLDGDEKPQYRSGKKPCILVCTSAGEVGFDLNADHMVCDASPLDSMIQRSGRVNRRGYGDATVRVFVAKPDENEDEKILGSRVGAHTYETAAAETVRLLGDLERNEDGSLDGSPRAIVVLKSKEEPARLEQAASPKPVVKELTDILLDAWSMTTIVGEMPGRAPVAGWLRGVDKDLPQTTVAWRGELDVFGQGQADITALEQIFQKHRIRPHETLSARTDRVIDFLKKSRQRPGPSDPPVLLLGEGFEGTTVQAVLDDPERLYSDSTLVLPPTLGGLGVTGMLDDASTAARDVADEPGYEREADDPSRLRILLSRTEDGWAVKPMPGAALPESAGGLSGDTADDVIAAARDALGLVLRLKQPLTTDSEGDVSSYLVSFYPARSKKRASAQLLEEHVSAVEACARRIGCGLDLAESFQLALAFAAMHHDDGKKTRTWQQAVRNADLTRPLGKSGGRMNVKRLGGYRHEFGTLLRVARPRELVGLPAEAEWLELALHLIGVHHGSGRPHFSKPDDVDFDDRLQCSSTGVEAACRFARLQRRYGYWRLAWLENLLRCADAMASADNEEDT
jgi:CRISPR-associated endonuclease/helicase Cas3